MTYRRVRKKKKPQGKQLSLWNAARETAATFKSEMMRDFYLHAMDQRIFHDNDVFLKFIGQLTQQPVSIEEFLDSDDFMGSTDLKLWPAVRKAIVDLNKDWWKGKHRGGAMAEGLLMGATGCVDKATEFLTPMGWKPISEYQPGDKVAEYDRDGSIVFREAEHVKLEYGGFLRFHTRSFDQLLTPGHRVIYRSPKTGRLMEKSAEEVAALHNGSVYGFRGCFIGDYSYNGPGLTLTDAQIRVQIAVMADGSFQDEGNELYCRVNLKKSRKKQRLTDLLGDAGIAFNRRNQQDGYSVFTFYAPQRNKTYEGWWTCSQRQLEIVADEVFKWDGTEGRDEFYTRDKQSADFVQHAFGATGHRATVNPFVREDGKIDYVVHLVKNSSWTIASSQKLDIDVVESEDGFAYCFRTRTGMWLSRRNGKVVVTGNTGKSEIIKVSFAYTLHLLHCCKNPQALYNLPKATTIVLMVQAAKPHVTKKIIYLPLRNYVQTMPWFRRNAPFLKQVESEMYFPELNIRVVTGGSDSDSVLGEAIIAAGIDEVNFMNVVQKSKKAELGSGRPGVYDQARNVYDTVSRRRSGRFMYQGPHMGHIFASSSTRYVDDFTDKRLKEIRENDEFWVYVYNLAQYEARPPDDPRYSGEKMKVVVANAAAADIRILEEGERALKTDDVMEVPVEYKEHFLRDAAGALRDVVGMSVNALTPFIRRRNKIDDAIVRGMETGLESFLVKDNVNLGLEGLPRVRKGRYCANPGKPRYVHIDLAINGDRCGVAMLRFDGFTDVVRETGEIERLPLVTVEMAVSIQGDHGTEVDLFEIRSWVKTLKKMHGYPIRAVTYDGWNSLESRQQWKKERMKTGEISVDRTSVPYKQLRDGFYDDRITTVANDILLDELYSLEFDETKDKVDHPPNGCFTGDTRVALADGTCPTFAELAERYATNEPFYVYTMTETGVGIAPAYHPRVTKHAETLVEVTLDNFQVIRCTPEHLFMTLQGEWIKAENLTPDVSIMPLYRSREYKGGWSGYERVWCPIREERFLTHHLAAGEPPEGYVVHHLDKVKHNNDPHNLEVLPERGHARHHGNENWSQKERAMRERHRKYQEDKDAQRAHSSKMKDLWDSGVYGSRKAECSIEGCSDPSNARGLCGKHYQQARRAKTLPQRVSKKRNHRVLSVIELQTDEDVYDITVPGTENFALASGVFVHNSKDVADAVCGAYVTLLKRSESWVDRNEDAEGEEDSEREDYGDRFDAPRS